MKRKSVTIRGEAADGSPGGVKADRIRALTSGGHIRLTSYQSPMSDSVFFDVYISPKNAVRLAAELMSVAVEIRNRENP